MKLNWRQWVAMGLFVVALGAGALQYTMDIAAGNRVEEENYSSAELGESIYVSSATVDDQQFKDARLERDESRNNEIESLKEIVVENANAEAVKDSQEKLLTISSKAALESKIESILKQKGFEDAMVYIASDDSVDVLVKAEFLDQKQASLISDTVSRQADVEISQIIVKNVW